MEANATVVDSSGNVSTMVQNASADDPDAITTTDVASIVATTAAIPANGTFTVSVLATCGAQSDASAVDEAVSVKSPQTVNDAATCVTTITTVTTSGSSDGTSYTSN